MNQLAQFRDEKMKQAELERFENARISNRDEAEELYADIQAHRNALMQELTDNDSVAERQIIHDVLYELKTVRNKIGSQLNAIARAKIQARNNGQ